MNILKHLLTALLLHKTRMIVRKHKPMVVAVTGSYGKTSVRNAIALALGEGFRVRVAAENYNNELGVPLSVLGMPAPGRSLVAWVRLLLAADRLFLSKKAPFDLLVLEYGADRPGDITRLCDVAEPDVAVLTGISPVHLANYPSFDALKEEKATLLRRVKPHGLAIVNGDDAEALRLSKKAAAPVVTYGMNADRDVRGDQPSLQVFPDRSFEPGETFATLSFHVATKKGETDVVLENVIASTQASACLAAFAVAEYFRLPLARVASRLRALRAEPGRLQLIPGIKGSLLLDDSYNAAPAAMHAALDVLDAFPLTDNGRRIAVLGHMAELGTASLEEHRAVGEHVARSRVDFLAIATDAAQDIWEGAIAAGFPNEKTARAEHAKEAAYWLDRFVRPGDVILIKGAQSARTERIVKALMAEPERAGELLCRQYGAWVE